MLRFILLLVLTLGLWGCCSSDHTRLDPATAPPKTVLQNLITDIEAGRITQVYLYRDDYAHIHVMQVSPEQLRRWANDAENDAPSPDHLHIHHDTPHFTTMLAKLKKTDIKTHKSCMGETRLLLRWNGPDASSYELITSAPGLLPFQNRIGYLNGQPVNISNKITRWADKRLDEHQKRHTADANAK